MVTLGIDASLKEFVPKNNEMNLNGKGASAATTGGLKGSYVKFMQSANLYLVQG